MAIIETLSIQLRATTTKFISDLKTGMNQLKSFGSGIAKVSAWAVGLGAALFGLGGFKLGQLFRDAFKDADRIGKISDEIGITVDEMMGLQHAATITGTSMEVLIAGLQRMNRRVGEASMGYGEAIKGLQALGISIGDIKGKGGFQQFSMIADGVAKLSTQTAKAAAVYSVFGDLGQKLLNTMQLQRAGLKALADENKRLMGTFTRDEFRVFEKMNDDLKRLNLVLRGTALKIGNEFSGVFSAILTEVSNVLVVLRERFLPFIAGKLRQGILGFLDAVHKWAPVIVGAFQLAYIVLSGIWNILSDGVKMLGAFFNALTNVVMGVEDAGNAFFELDGGVQDSNDSVNFFTRSLIGLATILKTFPKFLTTLTTTVASFGTWLVHKGQAWLGAMGDILSAAQAGLRGFGEVLGAIAGTWAEQVMRALRPIKSAFEAAFTLDLDKAKALWKQAWAEAEDLVRNPIQPLRALGVEIQDITDRTLSSMGNLMTEANNRLKGSLNFGEFLSVSGVKGDWDKLLNDMLDTYNSLMDKNAKGARALRASIERIKGFKMKPLVITPSQGAVEVAKSLERFTSAPEFGSQEALKILATAGANRAEVLQKNIPPMVPKAATLGPFKAETYLQKKSVEIQQQMLRELKRGLDQDTVQVRF